MKRLLIFMCFGLLMFAAQSVSGQNINASQVNSINIDNVSDDQIQSYWNKAKAEGYSLDELEVILKSKGMSVSQFSKLRQRITALRNVDSTTVGMSMSTNANEISGLEKFGFDGVISRKVAKNLLFGYDFFNNPNISFTPNMNLATPTTYQLGPGDELLIDIWGAAENNYKKKVDREGAIRIENIGPIYVSGLSVDKAKEKIISYLKKIYSGIGASGSSYNKVFAEISLVGVRTVQINIIGEVKVPGTYSLSALSTVLNALYASGGPTENGTFRNIKLVREGILYHEFDIYKYLIEGSEKGNELLRDQDIIIVAPYSSKIFVEGNVKRPGIYELKQGETMKDLTNYFSGFTAEAYKERLLIERVNGEQKEVNEVILSAQDEFMLQDGDKLIVGQVVDRYENRVRIGGAVYRPGAYELTEGLTLTALIKKAAGLKDDAFLDRGIIYRTIDDVKQELLPFSVDAIIKETATILLKREDSIQIFSKHALKENYTVTIDGAINKPQSIEFIEKMRVEDLIAVSGGFLDGADPAVIDIYRRIADGKFKTISKNMQHSSSKNLLIAGNSDFFLEPFDRVSVRYLKGYTAQKNVSIAGEVSYPGNYAITDKDERISDLVYKAGGFSPYAYLKGATIIRKVTNSSEKAQLAQLEVLIQNDTLSNKVALDITEFKIGIDLEKIMSLKGQKSKYDLILKEGDKLMIPVEKQTVEVRGEVLSPSLSRFDTSKSLKDYINNSGGFSDNAKKKKAYVIYANGAVNTTKNFIFFKLYPKITPGALIVVPTKPARKERMSIQEILGITTGLTTIGVLINTLLVK